MASLRSITQTNPDSIVYDERTKQYHDSANRYRMVKKSVAEAMRAAVSSGAPTRDNENLVSQATFDAFRKDIYKHISETARLTKIGLEELKKSLDYQTKETEQLQRIVNRTDEESQEQNKIEKIDNNSGEKTDRKKRRGMSISSFLGLGIGGLLGTFFAASMLLSPQQHQQIGEMIDQMIDQTVGGITSIIDETVNVITSMIDTINRINNFIQPLANIISRITEPAPPPPPPPPDQHRRFGQRGLVPGFGPAPAEPAVGAADGAFQVDGPGEFTSRTAPVGPSPYPPIPGRGGPAQPAAPPPAPGAPGAPQRRDPWSGWSSTASRAAARARRSRCTSTSYSSGRRR